MKLSILVLAALVLVPSIATAKEKKPAQSVKVHVCESVDLYFGPVSAATHSERIANACADVAPSSAAKRMQKCSAQGAESCEVLLSADKSTVFIEHKIQASKEASK